jgi:hypothetical protein
VLTGDLRERILQALAALIVTDLMAETDPRPTSTPRLKGEEVNERSEATERDVKDF